MRSRVAAVGLAFLLVLLLWLFVGIERIDREHGTDYEPFAKQTPSFKIVFQNTAQCGECDLRPWGLMSPEERSQFAEYCAARFGLGQVRPCYAIFAEKQRIAAERHPHADPAP